MRDLAAASMVASDAEDMAYEWVGMVRVLFLPDMSIESCALALTTWLALRRDWLSQGIKRAKDGSILPIDGDVYSRLGWDLRGEMHPAGVGFDQLHAYGNQFVGLLRCSDDDDDIPEVLRVQVERVGQGVGE